MITKQPFQEQPATTPKEVNTICIGGGAAAQAQVLRTKLTFAERDDPNQARLGAKQAARKLRILGLRPVGQHTRRC